MENLRVPPGFASNTSFTLKRPRHKEDPSYSHNEIEPQSDLASADTSSLEALHKGFSSHRPWILHNQLNHDNEDSELEQFDTNLNPAKHLSKGVLRGCSNCSDCLKVTTNWRPEEAKIPIVEKAPVFHPTEEEFRDTLRYVAKIRSQAEGYGICRVVPPPSWNPPYVVKEKNKSETSRFSTNVQRVNELQVAYSKRNLAKITEALKGKSKRIRTGTENGNGDGCTSDLDEVRYHTEGFEFECGPKFTFETFKKYADDFKEHYFSKKDKVLDADVKSTAFQGQWMPSVEDIEGEYWRIVENPSEEIEVLYSSDLETKNFGSGFPVLSSLTEKQDYAEYLESGWNLNNVSKLPGSLLAFESCDNSTMSLPRLHVGMCLSSLCWKTEEHHLYSLNYMHCGAPKIWYGIPWSYFFKFEAVLNKKFPDLLKYPKLRHELIYFSALKSEGIPVYRCVQYPREFLLILPGVHYSGIDTGFNCYEAVNFAPFDWLPHGQNVLELYSAQSRKTSISHDMLLLQAAMEAVKAMRDPTNMSERVQWTNVCGKDGILTKALKSRVAQECRRRKHLCNSLRVQEMKKDFDSTTKRECSVCFYDLHLSAACCSCSPDRFACLLHAKMLCSCAWGDRFFVLRYKSSELNLLVEALEGKSCAVDKWNREILGLGIHSSVTKHALPSASLHGLTFTSAKELESGKKMHPAFKEIVVFKSKDEESEASDTLGETVARNDAPAVQKISPPTEESKNFPFSSKSERAALHPGILSKGQQHLFLAPCSNSQPHLKKDIKPIKHSPTTFVDVGIARNLDTILAETPLCTVSRNKPVTNKSSSCCQHNVIILSDDEGD